MTIDRGVTIRLTLFVMTGYENVFLDAGQMEPGLIKNDHAWQCMLGAAPTVTIDP